VIERPAYRLELERDATVATLSTPSGGHWASLRLLAALDTTDGLDETLAVSSASIKGDVIELERRSTRWERARLRLVCTDDAVEIEASVSGRGRLTDAHLLGGRSLIPGRPTGFLPSGSSFRTLFSPNPEDPGQLVRPAAERAVIGVVGDSQPGRGHWFFTPAPLYLALSAESEELLGIGIAAPVEQLIFVQLVYQPADRAFSLRLEYDGHTEVDGEFSTPALVLAPGANDPYVGLRRHREDLTARGAAPAPRTRKVPSWWSEPIFCGWGAQCALAATEHRPAPEFSTQTNYDGFLAHLEGHGVVPGTIVIDDKWQESYGTCTPDLEKWPELKGWIAERRARGQHVLLWWKAWDAEGLAPELCIRNPDGAPIALDPTNPDARDELRQTVQRMLGTDGLAADGLKIDFTARTPTGSALSVHGSAWGIALLHELLATVYTAAKTAKPDALVITHTPHPSFVDVTDMIRLNDILRLDDRGPVPPVVPQMRYRAAVVRAACPELLIETDDWCAPNLQQWREYLEAKPLLGVPSLYYAQSLDTTGESFEQCDYEALRRTWEQWRAKH